MNIEVRSNFDDLVRYLDAAAAKQIPFVAAVSLTRLAQEGRADVIASLPEHFTLRGTWLQRGIRYRPAEKRAWPKTASWVGSVDDFMEAQEVGGEKRPRSGKHLGEPFEARPTKEAKVPPSKWPGRQLRRKRTFVTTLRRGSRKGSLAVVRRATTEQFPLQVLYVLRKSVQVRPRLGMRETVQATMNAKLPSIFSAELQKALDPKRARSNGSSAARIRRRQNG